MRFGFLTDWEDEIIDFASKTGFDCIEISANNPQSNFYKIVQEKGGIEEILRKLKEKNLTISSIGFYFNQIKPEKWQKERFLKLLEIAPRLNVHVISTFAGNDSERSLEDNIPLFKEVFSPYIDICEKNNLKIAIENCPMMHGFPFKGINLAYSPKAWNLMFETIDSDRIGLEFDPSHLFWLGVDYIDALKKFINKVFHFHAKDTEIISENLQEETIYGKGWWRYRIPGFGEIDWEGIINILKENKYNGGFVIEHEDPVFHGERRKEGLLLGYKYLKRFL